MSMGSAITSTCCCGRFLASRFGRVVVAIRENETRAMLLGYDPRLYKCSPSSSAALSPGLRAALVNWGGFISPTIFALAMSAEIIIFVLVGGLGTLLGPILGALAAIPDHQRRAAAVDPNLVLGAVLVVRAAGAAGVVPGPRR